MALNFKCVLKTSAKYIGFFVVFFLLNTATVAGSVKPFFFGLYLAVSFLFPGNVFLGFPYLLSAVLSGLNLNNIITSGIIVLVVWLVLFIHNFKKIKIGYILATVYALLATAASLYFTEDIISSIISLVLGLIFMFACINFFNALKKRNYNFKLNIDEAVCGAVVLIGIFCGLSCFKLIPFDFAILFAVFVVLVATYVGPSHFATLLGCAMGFGAALGSGNFAYIAMFCSFGIVSQIFKTKYKLPSCFVIILIHLLFGLYFKAFADFGLVEVIAVIIPCTLFVALPDKVLQNLVVRFMGHENKYAAKHLVNQNQELTSRKLMQISEVFYEMDKTFRQLVKGNLPMEDAKKMLIAELIANTCDNCPERNKCLRVVGEQMQTVFNDLINIGFEKGKVSLLDIPQFLSVRCNKVNNIVVSINSLLMQYKQYSTMVTNLDSSRVLIAEQLTGISKVLKSLAADVNKAIAFDEECEKQLLEELVYKNIIASEVSVYRNDQYTCGVSIILKNSDIQKEELVQTINKVCACDMIVDKITPSAVAGLSIVNLTTAPKYDVMFGLAQAFKDNAEVGGDTHSLIRIDNDKFMLAVCDGMGAGENAEHASNLAIGLVENFYKAGFDNDIILRSVNKLLNLGREDVFSALDICVLDLKNAVADFVKMGAPAGFIKHKDTITQIDSGSLPLGILEDIVPKISKTSLDSRDMLVLISDGVSDALGEQLKDIINNIQTLSPQELADAVLQSAKEKCLGVPSDDMTVLVARIFARS